MVGPGAEQRVFVATRRPDAPVQSLEAEAENGRSLVCSAKFRPVLISGYFRILPYMGVGICCIFVLFSGSDLSDFYRKYIMEFF